MAHLRKRVILFPVGDYLLCYNFGLVGYCVMRFYGVMFMVHLLEIKRPRVVFPPAQEERQPKSIGKKECEQN